MTKHKRFHGMRTKAQAGKAYAFFHAGHPYGSIPRKLKLAPINEKTPAGAANTDEGKAEKGLESSDSASIVH